jgi:formate dehydrogenase iron-sulfur subunit
MTALAAAQLLTAKVDPAKASEAADPPWAVLIDLTRCTGCNSCALACRESNQLPHADTVPQALSSDTFSFVDICQVKQSAAGVDQRYVKRQCMHCLDPACVSACPAAAMYKSEAGPVVYRSERCLGCRYCQIACPFGVPAFEWENGLTPVISKCWLCYDRLAEGRKPACVEACPTGALRFGKRDELLAQAHAQINSNPGRYVDHVFGEFEVGGTAMLYLSDIPFAELGFPVDLPETAPPQETEKIMNTLPGVIAGAAALMVGTAVYTHRHPGHKPTADKPPLPADGREE